MDDAIKQKKTLKDLLISIRQLLETTANRSDGDETHLEDIGKAIERYDRLTDDNFRDFLEHKSKMGQFTATPRLRALLDGLKSISR